MKATEFASLSELIYVPIRITAYDGRIIEGVPDSFTQVGECDNEYEDIGIDMGDYYEGFDETCIVDIEVLGPRDAPDGWGHMWPSVWPRSKSGAYIYPKSKEAV